MLTDDDLRHLLGDAAGSFEVPDDGPELVVAAAPEPRPAAPRRLLVLSAAAAVTAVAVVGGALVVHGRDDGRGTQTASAGGVQYTGMPHGPESAAGGATSGSSAGGAEARDQVQVASGRTALTYGKQLPAPAPAAAAAPGAVADTVRGPAATAADPAPVDGARVVKKGSIGLVVEKGQVTPTLTRVQGFATSVGGVVADAQSQEAGDTPSGSVTLRVPTERFERLVQQVRTAAPEVSTATTSGQDVTAQYADVEQQIRTLSKARDRFLVLLGRANSIGEVLSVQQRVDDVQGRIDRLAGQRKVLAAQSDTATLQVTVTQRDDPSLAKVVPPDTGLSKAVRDARDGFAHGVEALVRLSGPALLVVLLLAAAYGLYRAGRRAVRRRLV